MPDPADPKLPITLAQRFDRYREEVQQIVSRGIEHPRYELKRCATVARENLADRLDFVKLIQGVANAHINEERFIVIGADQKEKRFFNVENFNEFDPASLSQIVSKYLDPQPRFDVFNTYRTDTGESFVLIVFDPDQPRPVVTTTEGTSDKRTHFRLGDIWIKKDTSLQLATRADLDSIYEDYIRRRVDEEAETRARRRFDHFRETFGTSLGSGSVDTVPSADLLVGAQGRLARFTESAISTGNSTNIGMLLEMIRERIVERWDSLGSGSPGEVRAAASWLTKRAEIYRDEFVPSLDSTIDLGLQLVKYNVSSELFDLVIRGLIEAFEACRTLDQSKSSEFATKDDTVPFARPAYDVYVGFRALATYAVLRNRFRFLRSLLPHYVRFVTPEGRSSTYVPLLFWPFSGIAGLPDMRPGRNEALWNAHIHGAWGRYFGNFDKFLTAASQLEFILELNSYVVGLDAPEIKQFQQTIANKNLSYLPDFWANRLDPVVLMAERIYDILVTGGEFPSDFAVEKMAFDLVLKGKDLEARLLFLGGFLVHLKSWQAEAAMQQRRFPFMFSWEGRLKTIADKYAQNRKAK